MSKEYIINEVKSELSRFATKLGVTVLKELSQSIGGFAEKIQNSEVAPAQTSKEEQ